MTWPEAARIMVPAANPSAAPDTPDHFDTYFMSTPRPKPGAVSIVLGALRSAAPKHGGCPRAVINVGTYAQGACERSARLVLANGGFQDSRCGELRLPGRSLRPVQPDHHAATRAHGCGPGVHSPW